MSSCVLLRSLTYMKKYADLKKHVKYAEDEESIYIKDIDDEEIIY